MAVAALNHWSILPNVQVSFPHVALSKFHSELLPPTSTRPAGRRTANEEEEEDKPSTFSTSVSVKRLPASLLVSIKYPPTPIWDFVLRPQGEGGAVGGVGRGGSLEGRRGWCLHIKGFPPALISPSRPGQVQEI